MRKVANRNKPEICAGTREKLQTAHCLENPWNVDLANIRQRPRFLEKEKGTSLASHPKMSVSTLR
jgi:hypothetical protein